MNNLKNFLFTSESVSEGHPDKVSDRISDMVVDSYLSGDPFSRVACETLTTTNKVVLAGEVRGPEIKKDELIQKVRNCIKDIGYDQEGFTWRDATKIDLHLHSQSADIAMGVDSAGNKDEGAGDQGIMLGYACKDTKELMPLPIHVSHRLTERLSAIRKNGTLPWLRPDGKSQVSVEYNGDEATLIDKVVIATQHDDMLNKFESEQVEHNFVESEIIEKIDIGGIALIRAAAKNYKSVLCISSKSQYEDLIDLLDKDAGSSIITRKEFATKAFKNTMNYDSEISKYFNNTSLIKKKLRYGENPHQEGVFIGDINKNLNQLHGKEISFNNLLDIDSAINLIKDLSFEENVFAILKHNNPCGVAIRSNLVDAYKDSLSSDNVSAFGGVLVLSLIHI